MKIIGIVIKEVNQESEHHFIDEITQFKIYIR